MSFIAVDIGNSFTKIGSVQKDRKKDFYFKFPTQKLLNKDESIEDDLLVNLAGIEKNVRFGVASVVPAATKTFVEILSKTHSSTIIHVIKHSEIPLASKYKTPEQVGIDRLLAALGAYTKFNQNLIIISLGTAITIDCVNESGEFLGGVIAPGIGISSEALAEKTAQLPKVVLEFPEHVLGQTTEESIQSGIMNGAVSMIDGLVEKLKKEVFTKKKVLVFATGGGAAEMIKRISADEFQEYLVLEGIVETMATIYGRA